MRNRMPTILRETTMTPHHQKRNDHQRQRWENERQSTTRKSPENVRFFSEIPDHTSYFISCPLGGTRVEVEYEEERELVEPQKESIPSY